MSSWEKHWQLHEARTVGAIRENFFEGTDPEALSADWSEQMLRLREHTHVFEPQQDLAFLFEHTSNQERPIRLPFPVCFIDAQFQFEDSTFEGILIYEAWRNTSERGKGLCSVAINPTTGLPVVNNPHKGGPLEPVIFVEGVYYAPGKDGRQSWGHVKSVIGEAMKDVYTTKFGEQDTPESFEDMAGFIKRIAMNFHDFSMTPDVKVINLVPKAKGIQRRMKKHKGAEPPVHRHRIILTGETKVYADQIRTIGYTNVRKLHHVRAHWRNLQSDVWKHKKGLRVLVPAHFRGFGVGIPENKVYKLKQPPGA